MTLRDLNLIALMPQMLRDDLSTQAVCYALQDQLVQLISSLSGLLMYTNIGGLSGSVLDEIAYGLNIPWYSSDDSVAAKRETVSNALAVFRRQGTASAIKDAVAANFGAARVEEWFEYSGTPGHFRIMVTDESATTSKVVQFLHIVNQVKNLRSVLDTITLMQTSAAPLRIGTVSYITRKTRSVEIYG